MIELHNYGYALFKESETHLKDYISLYDSLYEQAKHYAMDWLGMTEDEAHCWATGYVLGKLAAKALIDKYSIVYTRDIVPTCMNDEDWHEMCKQIFEWMMY